MLAAADGRGIHGLQAAKIYYGQYILKPNKMKGMK
jgi:hypothetical protein